MRAVGLPFPGDEGEARWNQAWAAITGVWASKWNDRAFLACKKAGLQHENLSMAVLCQQARAPGPAVALSGAERGAYQIRLCSQNPEHPRLDDCRYLEHQRANPQLQELRRSVAHVSRWHLSL